MKQLKTEKPILKQSFKKKVAKEKKELNQN
jgi:hypothetical protein